MHPAALVPEVAQGDIVIINREKVSSSLSREVLSVKEDIDEFFKKVFTPLK